MTFQNVVDHAKRNPLFLRVYSSAAGQRIFEGARWTLMRSRAEKAHWRERERVVLQSPDNASIPRCRSAGKIISGCLVMHNGILVRPDSYYNYAAMKMIRRNRGVHEPQEERAFQAILPHIPPSATMLELGAYWAFYSAWFCRTIANARCIMVEPVERNLRMGQETFRLNGISGSFVQALVGERRLAATSGGVPTVSVDSLMQEFAVDCIHLLHSDIQGHEGEMLEGSRRAFSEGKVRFAFISTHSDEVHRRCVERLQKDDMVVIAEHSRRQSYSGDGLIVAKHASVAEPRNIEIAVRP